MKTLIGTFVILILVTMSCMPSASLLTNVDIDMDNQSEKRELGQLESVSSSFVTEDGRRVILFPNKETCIKYYEKLGE